MPLLVEEVEDSEESGPRRRPIGQRKSSISETFSKFTSTTFTRKRSGGLPDSTSVNQQSRLPTPSGIPRSTSFFSSLNSFATKSTSSVSGNELPQQPAPVKRSRKISDRLAQTPFFSLASQYQNQPRVTTAPITPRTRRDSAVKIEQHGLMQPIHPPLPKSSTMGNLGQGQGSQSSPHTPSYMRPTSSSAARRGSITSPKPGKTPLPTMPSIASRDTPSQTPPNQQRTPTQKFPIRKDSLPPPASAGKRKGGSNIPPLKSSLKSAKPAGEQAENDLAFYGSQHNFYAPPFKPGTKQLSAKAAGKQPMAPDMALSTSGGQDSGVAFTGDEEVQRQFEENIRRAAVLSRNDHPRVLDQMIPIDYDYAHAVERDSDDDNKLVRTKKAATAEPRIPQADPSNLRQVSVSPLAYSP